MPIRPMVRPVPRLVSPGGGLPAKSPSLLRDAGRILGIDNRPIAPVATSRLRINLGSTLRLADVMPEQGASSASLAMSILSRLQTESSSDLDVRAATPTGPADPYGSKDAPLVFTRTRRRPSTLPAPSPPSLGSRASREPAIELSDGADPGTPLTEEHRSNLEPVVGTNLRDVRIHTGEFAATMAARLRAEAFTVGRDVYFGRGRFDPSSPRGQALLAHELVHVRQQASQGQRVQRFGGERDGEEIEAEHVERGVLTQAQQPSGGLRVDNFARNYAATDGKRVSAGDRARLDAISARALTRCEQALGPALVQSSEKVVSVVEVALTVDLAALSNEQAAEQWGMSMADAIRAQLG